MKKRSFFLIAALGLFASLAFGTPSQAGPITFTYTATITSNTLSYTDFGTGSGTVTPSAIAGTQTGLANPTPSLAGASDPIGGYTYTYNNAGPFPPDGYFVSGSVDVKVTVKDIASGHTGSFTVVETYGNLVSSNTVPPSPGLSGQGASQQIGANRYTLVATSVGTNSNVPGTAILVGFEYSAVAIPEPASMALLGIGMAGFLAFRRFFEKRATKV
jgi:hypothetical protein